MRLSLHFEVPYNPKKFFKKKKKKTYKGAKKMRDNFFNKCSQEVVVQRS